MVVVVILKEKLWNWYPVSTSARRKHCLWVCYLPRPRVWFEFSFRGSSSWVLSFDGFDIWFSSRLHSLDPWSLPSLISSFLPFFLDSFFHSFLPPFLLPYFPSCHLLSCLHSFRPSLNPSFITWFLPSSLSSCLPSFVRSFACSLSHCFVRSSILSPISFWPLLVCSCASHWIYCNVALRVALRCVPVPLCWALLLSCVKFEVYLFRNSFVQFIRPSGILRCVWPSRPCTGRRRYHHRPAHAHAHARRCCSYCCPSCTNYCSCPCWCCCHHRFSLLLFVLVAPAWLFSWSPVAHKDCFFPPSFRGRHGR